MKRLWRFLSEPVHFSAEWKFLLLLITFGIITNYAGFFGFPLYLVIGAAWAVAATFLEGP